MILLYTALFNFPRKAIQFKHQTVYRNKIRGGTRPGTDMVLLGDNYFTDYSEIYVLLQLRPGLCSGTQHIRLLLHEEADLEEKKNTFANHKNIRVHNS